VNSPSPHRLANLTWPEIAARQENAPVAIVPLGQTVSATQVRWRFFLAHPRFAE